MGIVSLQAQVDRFQTEFANFQNGTKDVRTLTPEERRILLDAIAPNGLKLHLGNDILQVGDQAYGELNGVYVEGTVLRLPVNSPDDLEPNDEF